MLHNLFRTFAPLAALAMGVAVSGCDNMDVKFDGPEGVPLAELDTTGAAPTELALAGPDTVRVTEGKTLTISVEGDKAAIEVLRFALKDDTLTVTREKNSNVKATAIVNVTMPAPKQITSLGSGAVEAHGLADEAQINLLGSGKVSTAAIKVKSLNVNMAGSGAFASSGTADSLELLIGGSGKGNLAGLKAGKADVKILGSGSAEFASDGNVDASIMGSGEVTVTGEAQCTISAMGSGKLNCKSGATERTGEPKAPDAPKPPAAPEAPATEG